MPRIPDHTRLAVVDAHLGHWEQVDNQQGIPLELVAGYGKAELQVQRDAYHDRQEAISQLESDLRWLDPPGTRCGVCRARTTTVSGSG